MGFNAFFSSYHLPEGAKLFLYNSDQTDAAIITPAAKPKKIFCNTGDISFLKKKTIDAPSTVARHVAPVPMIANINSRPNIRISSAIHVFNLIYFTLIGKECQRFRAAIKIKYGFYLPRNRLRARQKPYAFFVFPIKTSRSSLLSEAVKPGNAVSEKKVLRRKNRESHITDNDQGNAYDRRDSVCLSQGRP